MRVLIVESEPELGLLWKRHIDRQDCEAVLVGGEGAAIEALRGRRFDVIVLNLMLTEGSAFSVSDFASYRQPDARVIFVTNSAFFSDGSIFNLFGNARAYFHSDAPPSDLAAMVDHYALIG